MDKITYSSAGVDVNEGQRAVGLMKKYVKDTFTAGVMEDIGGFGGLFALDLKDMKEPVLVAGTDGVGTKLKLAFMMDKHDSIGQDCVAMCVNDILCQGAKPLFFLDYIATGRLEAEKAAEIVKGIAQGCKMAGCALIGGETAEMPGFYADGEYDVAGFSVGMVDKERVITGKSIEAGDVVIGVASSGVHSNGFSLVRKVFFEMQNMSTNAYVEELGETLGEALLRPTKIYVKPVLELLKSIEVKGMAHITGGGFYENIPRILPSTTAVEIELNSWKIPPIFNLIQRLADIAMEEMFGTFNMGVGLMLVVRPEEAEAAVDILKQQKETASVIGRIIKGDKQVILCQD